MHSGTPIDLMLSRLELVKQTDSNRWIARCPAHDDHNPSLSITNLDERLLIHCFGGCDAQSVMHAVGLSLGDLFEMPLDHHKPGLTRLPIDYKGLCMMSQHDALNLAIFLEDVVAGKKPSPVDVEICRDAYRRFTKFARRDL